MDYRDEEVFICASGTMAMFLTMEAIFWTTEMKSSSKPHASRPIRIR